MVAPELVDLFGEGEPEAGRPMTQRVIGLRLAQAGGGLLHARHRRRRSEPEGHRPGAERLRLQLQIPGPGHG
jgi:hypothetical protein